MAREVPERDEEDGSGREPQELLRRPASHASAGTRRRDNGRDTAAAPLARFRLAWPAAGARPALPWDTLGMGSHDYLGASSSSRSRVKIIRPAVVCSTLVTMTSTIWPRYFLPWSTTTMVPSSR